MAGQEGWKGGCWGQTYSREDTSREPPARVHRVAFSSKPTEREREREREIECVCERERERQTERERERVCVCVCVRERVCVSE